MCLAGGKEILSVACSSHSPDPPFRSTGASEETEGIQVTAGEDAYIGVTHGRIIDNHSSSDDRVVRACVLRYQFFTVSVR